MTLPLQPSPSASLGRTLMALLLTILAIGGALLGGLLLATGVLLGSIGRALGLFRGADRPARNRDDGAQTPPGVIEGEYRVIDAGAPRQP